MIRPPKMMSWKLDTKPAPSASPNSAGTTLSSRIGSSTMNAAPRKEPMMEPTPPMMIMNKILNDRSRLKPSGSTVPM